MRRTPRVPGRRTVVAVALACALTATVQQQPARAEPTTLTEVRAELDRLYHDAEVATDKYNAADEKVTAQQKRVRTLTTQIGTAEKKLTRLTSLAGAAARAQYRGGGLPAEAQFVLAPNPALALDTASIARQAQQTTENVLTALTRTREELTDSKADASDELRRLTASRKARAAERKTIEKHIADARKLEALLSAQQRRDLEALEKRTAGESQDKWEQTGILKKVGDKAGAAGRKAIAFATRQLGKPYVWGAQGPSSFDCSGLTSQAWLAAGIPIPRTSQEQWRQLKHVPVEKMRPGDLIIYFSGATHVAIYIGEGQIIHAPRPGRWVTVAPAASMAILGVVRPDA
ncbi:NlpC/P60 family protein [Streptomyces sp. NPDC006012]|uniref:C40 family peptidase n=1 Tax=Streptomyces sp. NPDC006012 TaxID=3364739 RepID=UPI0036B5B822